MSRTLKFKKNLGCDRGIEIKTPVEALSSVAADITPEKGLRARDMRAH